MDSFSKACVIDDDGGGDVLEDDVDIGVDLNTAVDTSSDDECLPKFNELIKIYTSHDIPINLNVQ